MTTPAPLATRRPPTEDEIFALLRARDTADGNPLIRALAQHLSSVTRQVSELLGIGEHAAAVATDRLVAARLAAALRPARTTCSATTAEGS